MLLKGCDNGLTLNWWTFVILLVHWSAKLCGAVQHLNDHLRKVLAIPVALSCELLIWNRSTNIYTVHLHSTGYIWAYSSAPTIMFYVETRSSFMGQIIFSHYHSMYNEHWQNPKGGLKNFWATSNQVKGGVDMLLDFWF